MISIETVYMDNHIEDTFNWKKRPSQAFEAQEIEVLFLGSYFPDARNKIHQKFGRDREGERRKFPDAG